jgi:hypothetical protein
MDYIKLHKTFIDYCKSTKPIDRIKLRNSNDLRLSKTKLYTEMHHIVPKSLGGEDTPENLVMLLPEEHVFVHKLRYKAFGTRCDMLAVRYVLNGLKNRQHIDKVTKLRLTKPILNGYKWIRQNSSEFRHIHGWQTAEGRKSISNARKGTMPAKDASTGKSIGVVSVNHPKVKSGEWVHITAGRKASESELKNRKPSFGKSNNNYKEFATQEFLLDFFKDNMDVCVEGGMFLFKPFNTALKEYVMSKFKKKINASTIIKNRFGCIDEFVIYASKKVGFEVKYNPYYRSTEHRKKLAEAQQNKCTINNGVTNKTWPKNEPIPEGWVRGKLC